MNPIAKTLILAGVLLIVIGIVWQLGGKQLGRLPGDIAIERQNFKFYFPLTTSILISVVISVILFLIRHFSKN